METIRGRTSLDLDLNGLKDRLANYNHVLLDLGTGDGRYARTLAETHPDWFILGVDAARENLCAHSRAKLPNLLFVIARAQALPRELGGLVSSITINFPWGSLLNSLLTGDPDLLCGLETIAQPGAAVSLRLNGGALAEAGTTLAAGTRQVYTRLRQADWQVGAPTQMDARALRAFPTTWAKRLAFGRDPRAVELRGILPS